VLSFAAVPAVASAPDAAAPDPAFAPEVGAPAVAVLTPDAAGGVATFAAACRDDAPVAVGAPVAADD
jgi:hypothetical protein